MEKNKFEFENGSIIEIVESSNCTRSEVRRYDNYIAVTPKDANYCIQIHKGLKVLVNDEVLNILKQNTYIQENFILNIKQEDQMWNVYFDDKRDVSYQYFLILK